MKSRPAFLFFPDEIRPSDVEPYLKTVSEHQDSFKAISFPEGDAEYAKLIAESRLFDLAMPYKKGRDRLMRRAFPLLSQIIFEDGISAVFFNTAMLRYNPETFLGFVAKSLERRSNLALGSPPLLHVDNKNALAGYLSANEAVRKGLMVDIFISFALSSMDLHIFQQFTNLNAGIFSLRPDLQNEKSGILRSILGMKIYHDTNLLAPLMAWNVFRKGGLSIAEIEVGLIDLEPLGKRLEERIDDLRFIVKVLENAGKLNLPDLVSRAFLDMPIFRPVFHKNYQEWFEVEVLKLREWHEERYIPPESPKAKKNGK